MKEDNGGEYDKKYITYMHAVAKECAGCFSILLFISFLN